MQNGIKSLRLTHHAGMALTSDWSGNSFIKVDYDKNFSQKVLSTAKKIHRQLL